MRAAARRARPSRCAGSALMRRTEVEVHHADLGIGYTAADWPADFVDRADEAPTPRARRLPGVGLQLAGDRHRRDLDDRRRARRSPAPRRTSSGGCSGAAPVRVWHAPTDSSPSSEGGHDATTARSPRAVPRTSASSPNLIITKMSVGDFDNNTYLLRCRRTDEQVLIDAAAEPDRILAMVGRRRAREGRHHPPARRPLAGARRGGGRDRRRDVRRRRRRRGHPGAHRPPVGRTATASRSASASSR